MPVEPPPPPPPKAPEKKVDPVEEAKAKLNPKADTFEGILNIGYILAEEGETLDETKLPLTGYPGRKGYEYKILDKNKKLARTVKVVEVEPGFSDEEQTGTPTIFEIWIPSRTEGPLARFCMGCVLRSGDGMDKESKIATSCSIEKAMKFHQDRDVGSTQQPCAYVPNQKPKEKPKEKTEEDEENEENGGKKKKKTTKKSKDKVSV